MIVFNSDRLEDEAGKLHPDLNNFLAYWQRYLDFIYPYPDEDPPKEPRPHDIVVTCIHRTPAENRAARGHPRSFHLDTNHIRAVDIGLSSNEDQNHYFEIASWLLFPKLTVIREPDHFHIEREVWTKRLFFKIRYTLLSYAIGIDHAGQSIKGAIGRKPLSWRNSPSNLRRL